MFSITLSSGPGAATVASRSAGWRGCPGAHHSSGRSDAAERRRLFYAKGGRSGREPAVAAAAVVALGGWDECLVWLTGWSMCASGEDWPRFYAWRAEHGERRSLEGGLAMACRRRRTAHDFSFSGIGARSVPLKLGRSAEEAVSTDRVSGG
jgi:hypothetical protein